MSLCLTSDELRSQLFRSQRDACDNDTHWSKGTIAESTREIKPVSICAIRRYFPRIYTIDTGKVGIHAFCDDSGHVHTIFQRRSSGRTICWSSTRDSGVHADEKYITRKPLAPLLSKIAEQRRLLFCTPCWLEIKSVNEFLTESTLQQLDPRGVNPEAYYAYNQAITLPVHPPVTWSIQILLGLIHLIPANFQAVRLANGEWVNIQGQVAATLAPHLVWSIQMRDIPSSGAILIFLKPHISLKCAIAHIDRLNPQKAVCLI